MENDKAPWTVAYIRMDSEPLFQSNDLKDWMKEKGIEPEHSPRYKHALEKNSNDWRGCPGSDARGKCPRRRIQICIQTCIILPK